MLTLGLTVACSDPASSALRQTFAVPTPTITVATQPLHRAATCTNRFIAHPLDHVTTVANERVRLFDSNGSGLAINDLDLDGDLDIVINNLLASSVVFENRLCGGAGLAIDLRWPGSQNSYALGAQLTLYTDQGLYYREVRANSGYLSGDPARVHFGLPATSHINSLTIRWPDGATSQLETLSPATLTTITRK